ncbi:MAG: hypothetical protein JWO09_1791 [Bacteroidetes bacterium]|nr:hypothetical protein [Bacteroidota bacterium]
MHFYNFKTRTALLLMCFLLGAASFAQVSTYTFSSSAGTYTPITGGTVITSGTSDDNTFGAMNIGFPFTYNGVSYTQFGANVNGWISMGPAAPTSSYNPISTGATNNIISGMGRDLQLGFTSVGDRVTGSNVITNVTSTAGFFPGDVLLTVTGFPAGTTITAVTATTITVSSNATTTGTAGTLTVGGEMRYEVLGTAPNRVCVVQWTRARRFGATATTGRNCFYNFQIRLYETSNVVDVIYGPVVTNPTSSTYEIGLRGASTADFNNRTTTTDWSATTAGATNTASNTLTTTVFPASGQTYTWTPPSGCTGTPVAGASSSSANPVCVGVNFTLSLSGATVASGLTYQWQSSTDGVTYSNITGATTATYSTNQSVASFYQAIVTCTASGMTATSTPVNVTMNSPTSCYCASNATSTADEDILNVTLGTLNNTSTCATTGGPGSTLNMYSDFTAVAAPSIMQGTVSPFSVQVGTCGGNFTNSVRIFIDFNQNGLFTDPGETVYTSAAGTIGAHTESGNITVPIGATPGTTRMRVVNMETGTPTSITPCGTYGWGETEDYTVNITAAPSCSGTPAPGATQSTPSSVCNGVSFTLSMSTPPTGTSGITFQWQSSPDNITYTNIAGATSSTYTTSQSTATYYQVVVTCTASSLSATSTPLQVAMNPFSSCYCTSTATSTADEDILNVTLATLNNTSTCATTGGAGSVLNMYSNYRAVAAPVLTQGSVYPFSVQVGTCGGTFTNSTRIFIDFNQNGLFTDAGEIVYTSAAGTAGAHTESGNITIPIGALVGTTGMRVVTVETGTPTSITPCGTYGWGETEDYLVNIAMSTACAGTPTPGVTQSSPASVCSGASFTLSMSTPPTGLSGITYQWQSSPDNVTYTNIAGATSLTYTTTQSASTYYQVIVTCTLSGMSATSTPVQVLMNPFSSCYCTSAATVNADEEILNVTVGPLSNSSTCGTTGGPGSSAGLYSNYTAVVPAPNLAISASYTFSIQVGTCGGNFGSGTAIYIDYNQNGLFTDAGEQVYVTPATTTGPHFVTGSFIVPAGAVSGNTRMRVINAEGYSGAALTPCLTYGYGETEDYLVNIVALPPNPPTPVQDPTPPTCTAGTNLTVPGAPAAGDAWYWQTAATGTSTATPVSGPYTVFLNGTYYVRTYNAANNIWSAGSDSVVVSNMPLAATPPAPAAAANPACISTNISMAAPATGTAYFWQGTNSTGASNAQNASAPYAVNASGTYYVAAFDSTTGCWSNTSSIAVMIDTYVPASPVVSPASLAICEGATTAQLNATASAASGSIMASFGSSLISTGTGASTYNTTVGSIPAGATITSTQLQIFGARALGGSYRSEIRVALSGATTLAPTQISTLTSAGLITPDPVITIPALPPAGGAVTLSLTETFDDGGTDASFDSIRIVINYTLPASTINWWDASSAGVMQGTGSPLETIGTLLLPDSNTPGTYTFFAASNAGSCASTRVPVNVVVNALPAMVLNDTAVCSGTAYTLDAQNAGSTYVWNTAATTQTVSTTTAGLYYVDITTAAGCSARDSMSLVINAPPIVNLGADVAFCTGDSILLDAANTGFMFMWSDSTTNQTITTSTGGNYFVTVTNPMTTCFASDSILVTVNPLPVINLGIDSAICMGDSLVLDAGNPGATYSWSDASTNQTLTVNSAATYFVFVSDPVTSCYSSDTITITQNTLPVVTIGADTAICNGNTLMLDAGHPGSSYAWSNASTTQTTGVTTAGTYSVLVTDANGCKGTDSINVMVNALPVVNLGADTTQCAGTVLLDAANTGSSFMWNNSTTAQTLTAASTGTYSVAVTDVNGCTSMDSVNVTINPLPVVNLGNDTIQCGGSLTLDAGNPGFTHLWYDSSTGQTLTLYATNTVSVTVTNPATGCMSMDSITVTFNQYPIVNLGSDTAQCAGSVTLNAGNSGSTFAWSTSATTQTINVSSSGVYVVNVTNAGCTSADTVMVTINPLPVVGFPAIAPICLQGGAIFLNATPAGGMFSGGAGLAASMFDPMVSGVGAHPVLYTYTDANSCSNSVTQVINVADCTGIDEIEGLSGVTVYPNPTSGMFSIAMLNANFSELSISITDIQGKEVFSFSDKNIAGDYNKQIDLEGLAKGIYYIRLNSGEELKIKKLIIN